MYEIKIGDGKARLVTGSIQVSALNSTSSSPTLIVLSQILQHILNLHKALIDNLQ